MLETVLKTRRACTMPVKTSANRPHHDKVSRKAKGFSNIAIVTHESCEPAFFACCCDDVTEYASNVQCYGRMSVHTYVCVLGAAWHDSDTACYSHGLELVRRPQYRKTLVQQTSELKHIPCQVMLIMSHGARATQDRPCPFLSFYDEYDDVPFSKGKGAVANTLRVYARETGDGRHAEHAGQFQRVVLKDVVDEASMCLLMCCNAGEIVRAHLEQFRPQRLHGSSKKPRNYEYFYFNCVGTGVAGYSIEILVSWIINLVDGPPFCKVTDLPSKWRPALFRIMQIVKLFGEDNDRFFDFLATVGLVSMFDDVKKQQQLEHRHRTDTQTNVFRVCGHKLSWDARDARQALLLEFRTLTLATFYSSSGVTTYVTPQSKELKDVTLDSPADVDTYLKQYKLEQACFNNHRLCAHKHS